ncbi:hypothetical protein AK812_SmicGene38520 [Symbiodinium microadriaticum]|uniref:Uncharacterized protein n=1 Tax=Symbiodinium microadriaticum TaxID=2951 RepID=A0A1Q9CDK3_SYMMI|nr:hypothetical protein AK812_SmicGene38520 [Symbiodinium microadriaticum]
MPHRFFYFFQDYAWWRSAFNKEKKSPCKEDRGGINGCLGFDLADILEQGRGPGLASSFVEAPEPEEKDQQLSVLCEERRFTLMRDNKPLLVAVPVEGLGFDIFLPKEEGPASDGAAFLLRCSPKLESWLLTSARCEQCEARGGRGGSASLDPQKREGPKPDWTNCLVAQRKLTVCVS